MLEQEHEKHSSSSSISIRQTKPVSYAFKVLNSQETVFHYKKRMEYFFDYLRLPGANLEEQAVAFMSKAKEDPGYVKECIIAIEAQSV